MENRFSTVDAYIAANSNTIDLFEDQWQENTTAIMISPREVDKTAKAIDIALGLTSQGRTVFYLTTQRISNANLAKTAGNADLYVHTPEFSQDKDDKTDYADIVIADLEEAVAVTGARIFIIDSLSRIAALSFGKNASASYIMKRLVALQVRYKISLFVLAHDATRAANRSLINLADSQIAIALPEEQSKKPYAPRIRQKSEPKAESCECDPRAKREKLIDKTDNGYMIIDRDGKQRHFKDRKGLNEYIMNELFFEWLENSEV